MTLLLASALWDEEKEIQEGGWHNAVKCPWGGRKLGFIVTNGGFRKNEAGTSTHGIRRRHWGKEPTHGPTFPWGGEKRGIVGRSSPRSYEGRKGGRGTCDFTRFRSSPKEKRKRENIVCLRDHEGEGRMREIHESERMLGSNQIRKGRGGVGQGDSNPIPVGTRRGESEQRGSCKQTGRGS